MFFPGPDPEITTVDGNVGVDDNTGQTWAAIHDDNGTDTRAFVSDSVTPESVRADKASNGPSFTIARLIYLFDTS